MKNVFVVLLALVAVFSTTLAQSGALDAHSKKIIDGVTEKYSKYNDIKAELSLAITFPESDERITQTIMAYKSNDKFKLNLGDQIIITDGKVVWNYFPEYNEVQINYYDETDMTFSPSNIFTMYNEGFNYRIKSEYKSSKGLIKVIELTPINKEEDYFKIELRVVDQLYEIVSAKVFFKSGERFMYTVNSFNTAKAYDDDFYTFKVEDYKGISVTDLR